MRLAIHNLSKHYSEQAALDKATLTIEDTHCLALIGPSGGGKSTLLRLLAGLEHPTSGAIEINGSPLPNTEDSLRVYRKSIGVVFQSYNLFPHLDALANIALPLVKVHGQSPAAATERAKHLLDRFDLLPHSHKRPAELSGGQNQRIAIARAIAHKPELVLFDEPTSALDPQMAAEVLDVIEELIHAGTDCIIVTHQMAFAKRTSEHTAFLSQGKITEHGASSSLFKAPSQPETKKFLDCALQY